jgi:hypothetical protein
MDDILKRLIDAELEAEKLVEQGHAAREEMVRGALAETRDAERRFGERIPEIHEAFVTRAQERAQQAIGEIRRRYDERHKELRRLANEHYREAVAEACALVLQPPEGDT